MNTFHADFAKSPDWRTQERNQRNAAWALYFVVEVIAVVAVIGWLLGK